MNINELKEMLANPYKFENEIISNELWSCKHIKAISEAEYQALYDFLEGINYHSANVVLFANRYGNESQVNKALELYNEQLKAGYCTDAIYKNRIALLKEIKGKI